jgi:hypothetical protein
MTKYFLLQEANWSTISEAFVKWWIVSECICEMMNYMWMHLCIRKVATKISIENQSGYKDKCLHDHHDFMSKDQLKGLQTTKHTTHYTNCLFNLLSCPLESNVVGKAFSSVVDSKALLRALQQPIGLSAHVNCFQSWSTATATGVPHCHLIHSSPFSTCLQKHACTFF